MKKRSTGARSQLGFQKFLFDSCQEDQTQNSDETVGTNNGGLSKVSFADAFRNGTSLLLARCGYRDPATTEMVLASAYLRSAVKCRIKEMAAVVRQEIHRLSPRLPVANASRRCDPNRIAVLRKVLETLHPDQVAALRDFYLGQSVSDATLPRPEITGEKFRALRQEVRARFEAAERSSLPRVA